MKYFTFTFTIRIQLNLKYKIMAGFITLDNGKSQYRPYKEPTASPHTVRDDEKEFVNTIVGMTRLMRNTNVSEDALQAGFELSAGKLGISPENLRERAQAYIDAENALETSQENSSDGKDDLESSTETSEPQM